MKMPKPALGYQIWITEGPGQPANRRGWRSELRAAKRFCRAIVRTTFAGASGVVVRERDGVTVAQY